MDMPAQSQHVGEASSKLSAEVDRLPENLVRDLCCVRCDVSPHCSHIFLTLRYLACCKLFLQHRKYPVSRILDGSSQAVWGNKQH